MAKIKECISHQDLVDMLNDYFATGNRDKFNEFVEAMYLWYQYELCTEYICKHYIIGDEVFIPFSGIIISRSYIQDFRHSWPFKSGGEFYSKLS